LRTIDHLRTIDLNIALLRQRGFSQPLIAKMALEFHPRRDVVSYLRANFPSIGETKTLIWLAAFIVLCSHGRRRPQMWVSTASVWPFLEIYKLKAADQYKRAVILCARRDGFALAPSATSARVLGELPAPPEDLELGLFLIDESYREDDFLSLLKKLVVTDAGLLLVVPDSAAQTAVEILKPNLSFKITETPPLTLQYRSRSLPPPEKR
jgi:hypothetical protein